METLTVRECATDIHNKFVELRLRKVTFTDFEPTDAAGFKAVFAAKFYCPEGTEDTVRDALEYLDKMGALVVQRECVRPSKKGSKKTYPAEYLVTVELR